MTRMKDSGIEWIGEIPEEWGITKIKFTTQLNGRIGWQGLTSAEYKEEGPYLITGTDFLDGKINFETAVHIDEKRWFEAKQIQVENGDLLITKDGTVGKIAIIEGLMEKASLNSGVLRIQTTEAISRRFLFYVLKSDVFWLWFNYTNSGASTILHLYQNVFDEFSYAFPKSLFEQTQIADFLDKKVAQLDKVKSLLEEQIKTLEDYRQSLISETVTKGLDKNAPLKDSGIDWIGQIPEGWGIGRLKDFVKFQTGTTPPQSIGVNQDESGVPWFKPGDFSDNSIDLLSSENHITHEVVKRYNLSVYPKKTILLVGIASIGKVGYSAQPSYSNQQITALRTMGEIYPRYLAYLMFSSGRFIKETALYTVVPIINNQYLATMRLILPSENEQKIIVEYLDGKLEQISQMIAIKKEQIENINKQRQTLIYDYITGRRRV